MNTGVTYALAAAGFLLLSGCVTQPNVAMVEDYRPVYNGIETRLWDGDLVNFRVSVTGARDNNDVASYAKCAAAQYALIRGYGFARHVRTNVTQEGGVWQGDAVYTISPALPRGSRTIDAEVTVRNCVAEGIPTV
jgi:hypothetical protein